jgi:hypothetical protein
VDHGWVREWSVASYNQLLPSRPLSLFLFLSLCRIPPLASFEYVVDVADDVKTLLSMLSDDVADHSRILGILGMFKPKLVVHALVEQVLMLEPSGRLGGEEFVKYFIGVLKGDHTTFYQEIARQLTHSDNAVLRLNARHWITAVVDSITKKQDEGEEETQPNCVKVARWVKGNLRERPFRASSKLIVDLFHPDIFFWVVPEHPIPLDLLRLLVDAQAGPMPPSAWLHLLGCHSALYHSNEPVLDALWLNESHTTTARSDWAQQAWDVAKTWRHDALANRIVARAEAEGMFIDQRLPRCARLFSSFLGCIHSHRHTTHTPHFISRRWQ